MDINISDDTRELEDFYAKCGNENRAFVFLKLPQNEKFLNIFLEKYAQNDENIKIDEKSKNTESSTNINAKNHKFKNLKIIEPKDLAQYFDTNIKIICITGTNGKTTTSAIIYSLLLDLGYKVALLGTRGMFMNDKRVKEKGLTTPAILELYKDIDFAKKNNCEFFVMEVSSHAIKQNRICELPITLKAITNITSDHLDYHKTLQDYIDTKINFMKKDECIKIINLDDENIAKLRFMPHTFSYSIESKVAHLSCNAYSLKDAIFAHLSYKDMNIKDENGKVITQNFEINSNMHGKFNLYNILTAILSVKMLTNIDLQTIATQLMNFAGVSGRMEMISKDPLIIIDFAHTTDGMKQIFESFKTKNIVVIFGAGGDRDKTKRFFMGQVAREYAKKIIITNDNPRSEEPMDIANEILRGILNLKNEDDKSQISLAQSAKMRENVEIILDRFCAIKKGIEFIKSKDKNWVLLILGKGDENEQIIKDKKLHFSDKESVLEILKNE